MVKYSQTFKTFVSGIGFLADAYDLFVVNVVKELLKALYPSPNENFYEGAITTAALIGAICGQLLFGTLADSLGRKAIFVTTISLVTLGAIGAATCTMPKSDDPNDVYKYAGNFYGQVIFWQFLMGFGIGGEYPLSATVTSENVTMKNRGRAISAVFCMQGIGNLLSCTVMAVLLATPLDHDIVWRIAFACGGLPGLCTVYFRYKMEESEHFKRNREEENSAANMRKLSANEPHTFIEELDLDTTNGSSNANSQKTALLSAAGGSSGGGSNRRLSADSGVSVSESMVADMQVTAAGSFFGRQLATIAEFKWVLIGTAGNWFIFDVVFYAASLFTTNIVSDLGYDKTNYLQITLASMYVALIAAPAYFLASYTIDRIGRKNMQLMGFTMMCIILLILGGASAAIDANVSLRPFSIVLFGFMLFFGNFGPNMSTYVIPAEAFPTRAKATCHGLSAASGKLGAAVGTFGVSQLLVSQGLRTVFFLFAGVSVLGIIWTLAFTKETSTIDIAALDRHNSFRIGLTPKPSRHPSGFIGSASGSATAGSSEEGRIAVHTEFRHGGSTGGKRLSYDDTAAISGAHGDAAAIAPLHDHHAINALNGHSGHLAPIRQPPSHSAAISAAAMLPITPTRSIEHGSSSSAGGLSPNPYPNYGTNDSSQDANLLSNEDVTDGVHGHSGRPAHPGNVRRAASNDLVQLAPSATPPNVPRIQMTSAAAAPHPPESR